MIIRAFLSHGEPDKELVRQVAEYLGRAAVVFDVFEFATGDDLREAIIKGLSRSDIFVLFASKAAIQRHWVKFEISEAQKAHAHQALSRTLTYIIDPDLRLDEIPEWMRNTVISRQSSPVLIARDIQRVIGERLCENRPKYFVGRAAESEQALETIASFANPDYRPPLFVYGLNGIGRRTLVRDVGRNLLSYPKTLEITLREGDLLPELLLKVISATARQQIGDAKAFLIHHAGRSPRELVTDIVESFISICSTSTLPIIVDQGAISTEERTLQSDFDLLYGAISAEVRADCVIITNKRLHPVTGPALPSVRVTELSQGATTSLIRLVARDRNLQLTPAAADSMATYSRGYPPAIVFAIGEALVYGVDHVLANQHAVINFSAEIFLKQLSADKKLTREMALILQLLSNYSPMPLIVIQRFLNIDTSQQLAEIMSHLLDYAFVIPIGTLYRISEPIRDAAYRAFGGFRLDHGRLAELLEDYLKQAEEDDDRVQLAQNLYRATVLSNRAISAYALGLASDLVILTTQSYHDQDYDNTVRFGREALAVRPNSVTVRRFLAQAFIRKELFKEAEEQIEEMIKQGHVGEAFYVRGFMARRRRQYPQAIDAYLKSMEYGRGGPAIHRELASCYFELGDMTSAEKQISIAKKISPHNAFIVDLQCTIAIRTGDEKGAEKALRVLQKVDPGGFYDHRRSTFEQASGNAAEALRYAQAAVDNMLHPPFEVLANLANCQIEMNQFAEAGQTLHELAGKFGGAHHDAAIGLRCKLEIRRGDIEVAESLWEKIRDKKSGVSMGLRLSLLNRKATLSKLTEAEVAEQTAISNRLGDVDWKRNERLLGSVLAADIRGPI